MNDYYQERNEQIYKMRQAGYTFKEIGDRWGISRSRAQQINCQVQRSIKYRREYKERWENFNKSVVRILKSSHIESKKQLIELINDKNGAGIYNDRVDKKKLKEEIEKNVEFSVEISDAINPYDNRSIYIIKKGRKK